MNRRLVVNVTGSAHWRRRPVGIIRVERELCKQLHRVFNGEITPVVLDTVNSKFKHVSDSDFSRIFSDNWVKSEDPDGEDPIRTEKARTLAPQKNDQFITVGSDWSYGVPDLIAKLYGRQKALIPACYDLIPLIFPEYTPDRNFYNQFVQHYTTVAEIGKIVFSISEHSKKDLLKFWKESGLESIAPPVQVIPLASLEANPAALELSIKDSNLFCSLQRSGDYVIFVSTLEPRKNHQLMLDIWKNLYSERGDSCPQLLFVGMRGWGSTDLLNQMTRMPVVKAGKVTWLEGVSDELLSVLYENSLFSVFPSLYEGWGLAATEIMAHGKVCVVSNSSSLGEATQHLVPELHPYDFIGWRTEISRLIDERSYRQHLESKIATQLRPRGWDQFGTEFCAALDL